MDVKTFLSGRSGVPDEKIKEGYKRASIPLSIAFILGIVLLVNSILGKDYFTMFVAIFGLFVILFVTVLYFFNVK